MIQGCHERRVAARAAYPAAWKRAEAAGRKAFAGLSGAAYVQGWMNSSYRIASSPLADGAAVVRGEKFRITVLTDGLLRLEYCRGRRLRGPGERLRAVPRPAGAAFRVIETAQHLEIVTDRVHLVYDRGPFTTSGLSIQVRGNISTYHSVWRFGEAPGRSRRHRPHAGQRRRRGAAGARVVSRWGFAVLDDSRTLVLDDDGWVAPRDGSRTDLYFFGYGHDYPDAVRACTRCPARRRCCPGSRWATGGAGTTGTPPRNTSI